MKAKEYLREIRKFDILINNKRQLVEDLRSQATSITVKSDKVNVQTTAKHDRLEETIVKIIDLENRILDDIERITKLKGEVVLTIDAVDDADMINLLYKRYVYYEEWNQIADEMNFSLQNVYRLHGKALLKLQNVLDATVCTKIIEQNRVK